MQVCEQTHAQVLAEPSGWGRSNRPRVEAAAVAVGLVLGGIWTVSPGTLLMLGLALLVSVLLGAVTPARDRRLVLGLFLVGFLVRGALSVGLDLAALAIEGKGVQEVLAEGHGVLVPMANTRKFLLMPDSDYNTVRGYSLTRFAKGVVEFFPYPDTYGDHGFLYVIGGFHYLVGYSPMSVKFVNCLLGALLGPMLFFLGNSCFSRTTGRWAAIITSVLPSLMLWSITNLKEPALLFLIVVLLLLVVRLGQPQRLMRRMTTLVIFLVTLAIHASMRSWIYSTALAAAAVSAGLAVRYLRRRRSAVLAACVLVSSAWWAQPLLRHVLASAFAHHVGYAKTLGGQMYRYLPDAFYDLFFLSEWERSGTLSLPIVTGVAKAIAHYLLEPFTWKMDNAFQLLAYPQMIWWYWWLAFAGIGVYVATRWNLRRSLFLSLTLLSWILVGSLTNGNVGTVFRFRDMVSPLVILFGCVGALYIFCGRQGDVVCDRADTRQDHQRGPVRRHRPLVEDTWSPEAKSV